MQNWRHVIASATALLAAHVALGAPAHAVPEAVPDAAPTTAEPPSRAPEEKPAENPQKAQDGPVGIDQFLDRLMIAESGGRDTARNPRSTALGPFQFIASTWLHVMKAHFPDMAADKSPVELLSLRTNRILARKAAAAYTRELAAALRAEGLPDTFVNLRLAYLLGPSGSVPVLKAKPETPVASVVSAPTLRANPFLRRLTVADLKQRAQRELAMSLDPALNLKLPKGSAQRTEPQIRVRCDLARPSCKRWLALERRKLRAKARREARAAR